MRFEPHSIQAGYIRALLPKFDAAKWLEEINEAVSGLGEDPQFKGFYCTACFLCPIRAGSASQGQYTWRFPSAGAHELLKKDGKFDMNTWNESVIPAMLRLNLSFQGTAAQSDEFLSGVCRLIPPYLQ